LTVTTVVLLALAFIVTGALVTLTTVLNRTTSDAAISVESVRLAQEAEVDLLLHGRATSALLRRDIEERLTRRLVEARALVMSPREKSVVAKAEGEAAAYISASRDPRATAEEREARQGATFTALEALVDLNVAFARKSQAAAAAWNERANFIGAAVGLLLIGVATGLQLWLSRRAFVPVFSLLAAMDRFGKGSHDARALETGPTELREVSRRFNELAAALTAQRQAQIAFLGGVAHDIRTPLSVLQMSVALVPPDQPLPPEPLVRQVIEKVGRQIARLERMTTDFVDISKIEAGELKLMFATRDVRALVAHVVELFQGIPSEHRLIISMPDEPVRLDCDEMRIEQVLTNLVSNAVKYSPAGSAIEVALEPTPEVVVLRVSDHGRGIDEANLQRVFEPFRRAGLSKESVPGVGLGLFVVRRIVEAHGGHVDVASTLGAGTTFRVHLPRRSITTATRRNRLEPA
jgi:signal transduction histidine kinase